METLVILLLGGRSTRFWPLGDKPLLRFCGRTLFEHQVQNLMQAGLSRFLVVGQKDNLPLLQKISIPGAQITLAEQKNLTGGMAAALLDTASHWQGQSVLIVSGNDIIKPSGIQDLLQTAQATDGSLLAQRVTQYFPGGYLQIDSQNRLQTIIEKPGAGNEPSDLVNLVFHYHRDSTDLLATLQDSSSSQDDVYEVALQKLAQTKNYQVVAYADFWQALKYPWHALGLNQYFLSQVSTFVDPSAQIAETAVIKGNVHISAGVKIFDHATIIGPAYLGPNVIVGNNALIRESCVEENSVVGYNTEVARSLWQPGCQTHMNYTGDSVLGAGATLGAGVITANYRLDGDTIGSMIKSKKINSNLNKFGTIIGSQTHLGVHVTVSPGIKIGRESLIASHILLNHDIPDKQFVYLKNGSLKIVDNCPPPHPHSA